MNEPLEADDELFREVVRDSPVPVLVDFWAAWCGPCRMVAPQVHAVAKEMAGKAIVLKVNTEQHAGLSQQFGVRSIPNFILLSGGQVVMQRAGAAPAQEMRRWIEAAAQPAGR